MGNMRFKDGDYITLNWDGTPDEEHVKGHVTPEEFIKAYDRENKERDEPPTPPVEVRHEYARWSMEACEDGPGQVLRTYREPGPGRFKITTADYKAVQHAYWNSMREAAELAEAPPR